MKDRIKKILYNHFNQNYLDKIVSEILFKYNEPWRGYHDLSHIENLLDQLDSNICIKKFDDIYYHLSLCIIYHDIVYKPWKKNNEEQSAELFKKH